jgi:hypothetical protein
MFSRLSVAHLREFKKRKTLIMAMKIRKMFPLKFSTLRENQLN